MRIPTIKWGKGHFEAVSKLVDLAKSVDIVKHDSENLWNVSQFGKTVCYTDYLCLNGCTFSTEGIGGYVCDPRETDSREQDWESIQFEPETNQFSRLDENVTKATFVDLLSSDTSAPVLAVGAEYLMCGLDNCR